jgi:hypothetical protein
VRRVFAGSSLRVFSWLLFQGARAVQSKTHVRYGPAAGLLLKVHTKRRAGGAAVHRTKGAAAGPRSGWALLLKLPPATATARSSSSASLANRTECRFVCAAYSPSAGCRARCHLHKTNFLPEFFKLHHSQPAFTFSRRRAAKLFISLPQCVLCLEEAGKKSCAVKLKLVLRAHAPCPWAHR